MSAAKFWPLALGLLACSACMKEHNQPLANLSYLHADIGERPISFNLYFTSDLNLDEVYSKLEGGNKISQKLYCSLEPKPIFQMGHVIPNFGLGTIELANKKSDLYTYKADLYFAETKDDGRSYKFLNQKKIITILADRQEIPCKVVMYAFRYKAYFSNTLTLPVQDILPLIPQD
ncbi:hypothetical protein A7D27_07275 [Pseudomonas sp. 1D4]|uniref:hypothetical protein n=1 Tax=Pseudomonadaceae TaxID=135621 RepID=UPI00084B503A|nr:MULTISPECIES: hypothetical protein [Pseudomonas]OEC44668.1 hypothetical protein A7D27_07275 [Pseudomonas sp. 1D4]